MLRIIYYVLGFQRRRDFFMMAVIKDEAKKKTHVHMCESSD